MSTQLQRRRGTKAENDLFNGAEGEFTYDTDTKRVRTYDGSTVGGVPLPTYLDLQNNAFTAADAVGTDTITLDLEYAPTAYAEYQRFTFKPAANNTGAVTLNVNGLGAKNLKKHNGDGTYSDLEADDLILDVITNVVYNGTEFVLDIGGSGGWVEHVYSIPLNTTSATFFSGIPSNAVEIEVVFVNVTASNTSSGSFFLQIGDAIGLETSGYISPEASGFLFASGLTTSTDPLNGNIRLVRGSSASNTWAATGDTYESGSGDINTVVGVKTLSGVLSRVGFGRSTAGTGLSSGDVVIRYR